MTNSCSEIYKIPIQSIQFIHASCYNVSGPCSNGNTCYEMIVVQTVQYPGLRHSAWARATEINPRWSKASGSCSKSCIKSKEGRDGSKKRETTRLSKKKKNHWQNEINDADSDENNQHVPPPPRPRPRPIPKRCTPRTVPHTYDPHPMWYQPKWKGSLPVGNKH